MLKWAWDASPSWLTSIFNWSVSLGIHPWKDTSVVIIPKPHKPDYSLPKAYRPISLLECQGKLLEKVIARRLAFHDEMTGWMGRFQFGSRRHHSAPEVAVGLRVLA